MSGRHNHAEKFKVTFIASKSGIGLSRYFANLAIALKKAGNNIILVSSYNQEEQNLFEEIKEAKIRHYKLSELHHIRIKPLITEAKKLGKIIDREKPSIIHTNGFRHLIFVLLALKFFSKEKKVRIVVTIHSFLHGTPYEKLALLIEALLINLFTDLAIPVARSTALKLIKYGAHPSKLVPIYNGVELKIFSGDNDDTQLSFLPINLSQPSLLIGYFAELIPRKGHKYLIKAFPKVLREFPNAILILTGKGPEINNLKQLANALDIKNSIIFTGRIKYRNLYRLLKRIDIFVFPSLSEICPLAILEAMAAGKPIVATNVGGIPEIVKHNVNGILVPPKDPEKLADAIKELARNPEKARMMGEKSRELAEEKFSLDKIASIITRCYNLIVEK